ncbi:hypothetical protein F5888DRAFT_370828 [Russula emetica]|nr:hypothetical protein F5888DRAFT_370828 [Russula emetica]
MTTCEQQQTPAPSLGQRGRLVTRHHRPSTLLAFFDSESHMLGIADAGAGRAFLGRRRVTGAGGHECRELTSSGGVQYFVNSDTHSNARAMDVGELIDGTGSASPSRGEPDAASVVNVESVEVRDGDFLVLGSHDTWTCLDGNEAVQAVSGWIREQEVARASSTQEEQQQPVRRGRSWWPQDRFLDFPWRDNNHDLVFGFDWVHTMVPDLIRDVDKMFVSGNDQGFYAAAPPGRSSPVPGSG